MLKMTSNPMIVYIDFLYIFSSTNTDFNLALF